MRCRLVVVLLLFTVLLGSCKVVGILECNSRECLLDAQESNPSRTLAFWEPQLQLPIALRYGRIPDRLLEYLRIDNKLNGFPATVVAFDNTKARTILGNAVASLPAKVRVLVKDKLVGVYVVKNLGTSGYTESILNAQGEPVAGVIVLGASLFDQSGNTWASWRDSTAFIPNFRFSIRTTIAAKGENDIEAAVQFLLIHELGHVYSIGTNVHPDWYRDLAEIDLSEYPFSSLSWEIDEDSKQYRSHFDDQFWQREKLGFYQKAKIPANQIADTLKQLGSTNFVSIYATTRPEEDFAETFAIYAHTELMAKPYKVEALTDGEPKVIVTSCFRTTCPHKFELIESIMNQ
jgi:hypothetical protein